jgi:hypothetical protein
MAKQAATDRMPMQSAAISLEARELLDGLFSDDA